MKLLGLVNNIKPTFLQQKLLKILKIYGPMFIINWSSLARYIKYFLT